MPPVSMAKPLVKRPLPATNSEFLSIKFKDNLNYGAGTTTCATILHYKPCIMKRDVQNVNECIPYSRLQLSENLRSAIMEHFINLLKSVLVLCLCGELIIGCRKNDEAPGDAVKPGDSTSAAAQTISNNLQFFNAGKKQGSIPKGPAGSSLKISVEDTLYLFDEIKRPIKFLHRDTTKNVSGVYIQVRSAGNGGSASEYYDVPEISETEDSDTVSVIMIGIDPEGITRPQTFDITIVPYDKNRQPLAETNKPVKIDAPQSNPPGSPGSCGLVTPSGERWEWDLSFVLGNGEFEFYSEPFKVHSEGGQYIDGSCCSGKSMWPEFCPGEIEHNKRLHFATYYQISFENFSFFDGGNFFRQTMEDSPVPVPAESNFCGNGSGKVIESLKHTTYNGNWSIEPVTLPQDLQHLAKQDTHQLVLQYRSSAGTGYGNPGGVIHQLDCEEGFLTLIQLDREGGGKHLIKMYTRRKLGTSPWYNFN